jgi:integrase
MTDRALVRTVRAITHRRQAGELPAHVRPDEVQAALAAEPRADVRAFLRFLWVTGCRVTEAIGGKVMGGECPGARVRDLAIAARTVALRTLKRKTPQTRVLDLTSEMIGELAVLINVEGYGLDDRLFPWHRSRAHAIVRATLTRAGVEARRAHPHALRHGHAIHALRSGVAVTAIQRKLGHASIVTTSGYMKLTGDEVRAEYEKVRW